MKLTNLNKPFWPKLGVTKRDLIQYYLDVAPVLLPHLTDRAMVMKRYPNGAAGEFFFMKRAPSPRPDWIEICNIEHESGSVINFPMIQDLASLMWVINLGCIDLNQWYARCDDVDRPDYLHFDLDPVPNASFEKVCEAALFLKLGARLAEDPELREDDGLERHSHLRSDQAWTNSEAGVDVCERVCVRGRLACAETVDGGLPGFETAEGKSAGRLQSERVGTHARFGLFGETKEVPSVSTPVTWKEVERGITIEDFRIDNVPARVEAARRLVEADAREAKGRFRLEAYL